ncbi:MAG: hypothetical protein MZV64_49420 [Ignavibacteriales bacterium]|nr:hypothetical protein [Ignavibacteriales bacterium]
MAQLGIHGAPLPLPRRPVYGKQGGRARAAGPGLLLLFGLLEEFLPLLLDEIADGVDALAGLLLDHADALLGLLGHLLVAFLGRFARPGGLLLDLLARLLAARGGDQDADDEARGRAGHEGQQGIPEMTVLGITHPSSPFFSSSAAGRSGPAERGTASTSPTAG